MPKYLLILSILLPLATGCEREAGDDTAGQQPVIFTAHTGGEDATRASVIDDNNLSSMGVFACYTGQSNWSESTSKSNFMYNQPVNKTSDTWTYTPMKYWPNTEGDKLSFFAYAPHAEKVGSQLRTYGYNSSDATGYPSFRYEPPVDATKQTDLLFATPLINRTKGSELSFTMGHVLTHVLFKVKSTSAISVTKIQVNSGSHYGDIKFNTSGYSWTSLSGNQNFYKTATVAVPANTLTDLGEFFLLPSNAESVSLTFSEGGIEQPVTTVALPASPVWGMNKTVAYTLNIENKTKVTLSVKLWDTGSVSANLEEEVSGTYPYAYGGVIYESPTKSYYVGYQRMDYTSAYGDGWYTWDEAMEICRVKYSDGPYYGDREWRLPSKREMQLIYQFKYPAISTGSTYWTYETSGANAYAYAGALGEERIIAKTANARLFCIRDVGDLSGFPTTRSWEAGRIMYESATKAYYVGNPVKDDRFEDGSGGNYNYADAVRICNSEFTRGGIPRGKWRMPTSSEIEYIAKWNIGQDTWT